MPEVLNPIPAAVLEEDDLGLPQRLGLEIIKDWLPGVKIQTRIPTKIGGGFVLVRQIDGNGYWDGVPGLLNDTVIKVDTFTHGPNGESVGGRLQGAIRSVLFKAWRTQKVYEIDGHRMCLNRIHCTSDPTNVSDWATSSGPVQFADLSAGWFRWESRYEFIVRNFPS